MGSCPTHYEGGYDIFRAAGFAGSGVLAGDAEVLFDRAEPLVDLFQQRLDRIRRLPPGLRTTGNPDLPWNVGDIVVVFGPSLKLHDHLIRRRSKFAPSLSRTVDGDAVTLADQPEQEVSGADVVMAQLQGLPQRQLQALLRPEA